MSTEEIGDLNKEELVNNLKELTRELMNLKIQKSVGQLSAPHRLRLVRRNIARVKTILRLHEISSTLDKLSKEGEAA